MEVSGITVIREGAQDTFRRNDMTSAIDGMGNAAAMFAGFTDQLATAGQTQSSPKGDFQNAMADAAESLNSMAKGGNVSLAKGSFESKKPEGVSYGAEDKTANNNVDKTADTKADDNSDNRVADPKSDNADKTAVNRIQDSKAGNDKAAVSEAADKVLEEAARVLNMDPDELSELLAELGLTAQDLLIPENMNILTANVLGDGDAAALITDSMIFDTAAELNRIASDIMKEMGIDPEALKNVVSDVPEIELPSLEDVEPVIIDKPAIATSADDKMAEIVSGTGDNTMSHSEEIRTENTGADSASSGNTGKDNTEIGTGSRSTSHTESHKEDGMREDNRFDDRMHAVTGTENNVPQDISDNVKNLDSLKETPISYLSDPEQIAEQVIEHIKSNVREDFSSLEMTLNPASLGHVAINLVNNAGNVTAQFITENDAARSAIEGQVAILRQNLEQQGVKIDAVEVTVSSHAFEQNLEQGNDGQSEAENMEQEKLRRQTRKIDLGEYADIPEDLSEEDRVTADMMQADGGRMDYKV